MKKTPSELAFANEDDSNVEAPRRRPTFNLSFLVWWLLIPLVLGGGCTTTGPNIAAEEREQKHWQQVLAPYSDEQLRFKLESLNQWLARADEGMRVLMAQRNGLGVMIAKHEIDSKEKERGGIAMELIRREHAQPGNGTGTAMGPSQPDNAAGTVLKGSGTGFFILEDGFLITNDHVVKDATMVRLVTSTGNVAAKVLKVDPANDLALLKAEGTFAPLPVATSRTVRLGSTVATVGFPNIVLQGFAPKLAKGEIAALSGLHDDARCFQVSVPVQPGNSGGALVDERGNVVGVVKAKLNAAAALSTSGAFPENVNYAVKSSFLLSFLESVPEVSAKLKDPNTEERKFEDVVKSAEQAAVMVLVY